MRKILVIIGLTLLSIYLTLLIGFTTFQEKMIFFPYEEWAQQPPEAHNVVAVTFETEDGETLSGWWREQENAAGTVLFFHGNAGNVSHRADQFEVFEALNVNGLIFDYRGYGQSTGELSSEDDLKKDAEAALNYLLEEKTVDPASILLWGRSLGGGVAATLLPEFQPAGLILESTFSSLEQRAREDYPFFPIKWFLRYPLKTDEKLWTNTAPLMLIHSPEDEKIPFSHVRRLAEAASITLSIEDYNTVDLHELGTLAHFTFLELSGSHNEGWRENREEYVNALRTFIENL